jgi:phosphoenolpyruvate carboxylase
VLGLDGLTERDIDYLREVSPHFDDNMRDALQFMNPESMRLMPEPLRKAIAGLELDVAVHEEHRQVTSLILDTVRNNTGRPVGEAVLRAANLRGFLG